MASTSDQATAQDEAGQSLGHRPNDPSVPFKVGEEEHQGLDAARVDKALLETTTDSSESRSGADFSAGAEARSQGGNGAGYVPERLSENLPDKIERML